MAHWVVPPLPPNRTGGFPASGSPVGEYLHEAFQNLSFCRTGGCAVGDLKQGDQPLGSEPGVGVTVVIASVATSLALVSFSQDAAQAHSHPGVQFRAHASCPSLEVAAPAPYHPIYIDDDLLQGSPVTALGSLSDSFFELLLTLLTRPFVPALKMPAEELEAFSGARIHDPRFLRVQPQSGFFPSSIALGPGPLGPRLGCDIAG